MELLLMFLRGFDIFLKKANCMNSYLNKILFLFLMSLSFNLYAVGCYTIGGNTYDCNVIIDPATGNQFSSTNPMSVTGTISSGTVKILPSTAASAIVTSVSSSTLEASHVISAAPANLIGCF